MCVRDELSLSVQCNRIVTTRGRWLDEIHDQATIIEVDAERVEKGI